MRIKANNRTAFWLASLVGVLLLPGTLWGQAATPMGGDNVYAFGNAPYSNPLPAEHAILPIAPSGIKPYWKWFAPVDVSDYGNGIKPRQGFFFSYERVLMSTSRAEPTGIGANNPTEGDQLQFLNVVTAPITAPITAPGTGANAGNSTFNAPIASYPLFSTATTANPFFATASPINPVFVTFPGQNIQVPFSTLLPGVNLIGQNSNSDSTSVLTSRFGTGNRWEFGYMDVDDYGWLVSVLDHVASNSDLTLPGGTVLFNDPTGLLQGYQTSIAGAFDADMNGNHIYGRDGYAQPTQTIIPPVVNTTTGVSTVIPGFVQYTFPVGPTVPAPQDTSLYFPTLSLLNGKAVTPGTPGATTYSNAGGDEVVFTPTFTALTISDKVTTTGVEIMRMYRPPQLHGGGSVDLIYGVRYLQLNDVFQVNGTGGPFDAMTITQKVLNNVVGPQIGARYNHQRGRWAYWAEGRFFPAANIAVERNNSVLASNLPPATLVNSLEQSQLFTQLQQSSSSSSSSSTSNSSTSANAQGPAIVQRDRPANLLYGALTSSAGLNNTQFTPACEFRAGLNCWLTQGISFKCSYTGIFLPNMTRSANTIDYTLPNIGILPGGHHEVVVLNGLTFGIEINR